MFPNDNTLTHEILAENHRDLAPVNTRFWQRGLLTEKISRDNLGNETHREKYEYNFDAPIKKTVHGIFPFVSETWEFIGSDIVIRPFLVYYDYISQPIYMTKKTVSGIDTPKTVSTYFYDDEDNVNNDLDHVLLKKQIDTCGTDIYMTTIKYPFDYTLTPSSAHGNDVRFMKENHMSALPIEIVKYKNNEVIGGRKQTY